jgi:hypothetical protein
MSRSKIALVVGVLVGLYWLAMFAGTHVPPRFDPFPGSGGGDSRIDKVAHCLGFAGLAFLLCCAGAVRGGFRRSLLALVLVAGIAYASFDEWSQPPFGRDNELADWTADVLGIGVGLAAFSLIGPSLLSLLPGQRNAQDETPADVESAEA